jgi:translation elongation factor EF-4
MRCFQNKSKFITEEYFTKHINGDGEEKLYNIGTRSLSGCQGVILLVDANQGVQAQTVSNFFRKFYNICTIIVTDTTKAGDNSSS